MGDLINLDDAVRARADQKFRERWSPRLGALDIAAALPPVPWVCEELGIAPGSVTIVGGAGFGGKTVSMQAFLLAVASGKKAWGHFDVTRGKVVHIDYEQGRHLTVLRYQRIARELGIDLRDLAGWIDAVIRPKAHLDDKDAEDELVRLLDGARIAIVDAFRGAFPTAKENDSGVRIFLDMLANVSERTGCTIVVIAHSRKMSDDTDIRSSLRGSGAIFDSAQTVYQLDGHPKKCTRVSNTKDRWLGETREPFGIRIRDTLSPDPAVQDRRWGLSVEYVCPPDVQAEYMKDPENDNVRVAMNVARMTTLGNRLLAILDNAPDGILGWTMRSLHNGVATQAEIGSVLSELISQGSVHQEGKGTTAVYRRIRSREPGED